MVQTTTSAPPDVVQSVGRALELLTQIASSPSGISLSRLSETTGMNMSTAHRLLGTLIAYGYVYQNAMTKEYCLGTQSFRLGQSAATNMDVRVHAMDSMRELSEQTNEVCNLALLRDEMAVYIAQVQAEDRAVQMFTRLGVAVPLYCTGVGKALLAHMPPSAVEHYLATTPMQARTVSTIVNPLRMRMELERIRVDGYALDNEENEEGVRCVAAPIFQADGTISAAVSVSAPSGRFPLSRTDELGALVREAGLAISVRLGYRAPEAQE